MIPKRDKRGKRRPGEGVRQHVSEVEREGERRRQQKEAKKMSLTERGSDKEG